MEPQDLPPPNSLYEISNRWRGVWNSATTYFAGDAVRRLDALYIARGGHVDFAPESNPSWWHTILEGVPGVAGPAGPEGPEGPIGLTGLTGAQGIQGNSGIQGIQGETGLTGAQGIQGVPGDTGAQGAPGVDGQGVPIGGATGTVLKKASPTDFDTIWGTDEVGGGGGGGEHPDLAAHDTLGLATQAELDTHTGGSGLHVTQLSEGKLASDAASTYPFGVSTARVNVVDGWPSISYANLLTIRSASDTTVQYLIQQDNGTINTRRQASPWSPWHVVHTNQNHSSSGNPHSQYALDTALTTHKTSTDHDGRYYTETEVDTALAGKQATPILDADVPAAIARDSEVSAAVAARPISPAVVNADVAAGAAIAKSKLAALDIVNADVNAGAAIAKSKLAALAIANADVDAAAAIAESKLNLASDAAAGTASRRTLGTGAAQAAAGDHGHTAIEVRGGTVLTPAAAINVIVWRAPYACTVTNVRGYRIGGTGATVNARKNGTLNHLASALSLTGADAWADGGAAQNTAYAAGDKLEIMVVSVTGDPTQVAVQVDFTRTM